MPPSRGCGDVDSGRVALLRQQQKIMRHRARRLGPELPGMFDQHGADIARIVEWRIADEPGMVLELPRQGIVHLGDLAAVAFCHGIGMNLSRPGLAGHLHARFLDLDILARAMIGRRPHAGQHRLDMFGLEVELGPVAARRLLPRNILGDMGDDSVAAGQAGDHGRDLQRCRRHLPLADRTGNRLPRIPGLTGMGLLPGG